MIQKIIIVLTALTISSCNYPESKLVVLSYDKDLMPEGIAVDVKSERIFVNSLKRNKIVTCDINGSTPTTFHDSNQTLMIVPIK